MKPTTTKELKKNIDRKIDEVVSTQEPLYIRHSDGQELVLVPKSEYEGLKETLFLMQSPKNAERLLKSIEDLKKGNFVERELIE
ncbi:MAG: type II toxin-antitoxin system Phd/YefM family antitoxin [Cyclobacteriaceae bacterium]